MSNNPTTRTARGLNMVLPQVSSSDDPVMGAELTSIMQSISALARQLAKDFKVLAKFTQTMTPGDAASFHNVGGELCAQRADASAGLGKLCNGFVTIAASAGQIGEVQVAGLNEYLSGLTPGNLYFTSSTTPGTVEPGFTPTPGYAIQPVGYAVDENSIMFQPALRAELA